MLNEYDIGDLARVTCDFYNAAGALADPTTVALKIREPGGVTSTTYTYPADITKSTVGKYYKDFVVDIAGVWHYRWESTGDPTTAEEGSFIVNESRA